MTVFNTIKLLKGRENVQTVFYLKLLLVTNLKISHLTTKQGSRTNARSDHAITCVSLNK